jgi:pantothenate synthetase
MARQSRISSGSTLTAAVRAGKTRLIDNVALLEE